MDSSDDEPSEPKMEDDEESDDAAYQSSDDESLDSDEQLQQAFLKGDLKTGLNAPVADKHVVDKNKTPINNRDALEQKLKAIRLDLDWLERFDIVTKPAKLPADLEARRAAFSTTAAAKQSEPPDDARQLDASDDFERESFFQRQAQAACLVGLARLHDAGIPTRRPDDYFAEMLKSDEHMQRVRQRLLQQQREREQSDKAKSIRAQKKRGKQVQVEVQQQRQKEKKRFNESVRQFKKGQLSEAQLMQDMEESRPPPRRPKRGEDDDESSSRRATTDRREPNSKRVAKNARFGYGGKRKGAKYNTQESNDGFGKRSKAGRQSAGAAMANKVRQHAAAKRGNAKQKRPGKVARKKQAAKSRR